VVKDYYLLLEIAATSSADEVKRAFRSQIARYHPDKVHHLGKEFQDMAADRAAELTEAYRILSDAGRRAEYDRARQEAGALPGAPPPASSAPADGGASSYQAAPQAAEPPPAPPPPAGERQPKGGQFSQERATRDTFVRKATVGRFLQALEAVGGGSYDKTPAPGFDLAMTPKRQLFGRGKGPRLLGRFVSLVDREAVADAWSQAGKWSASEEVCVFLMGSALAPAGELAGEIAIQRRKQPKGKLTLIPVDARNWDAHMPLDAPAIAKSLLARLKSGS
jgi:curved DNA-binding protein CbpA